MTILKLAPALLFPAAAIAIAFLAVAVMPRCDARSAHGARIGGVILMSGCQ